MLFITFLFSLLIFETICSTRLPPKLDNNDEPANTFKNPPHAQDVKFPMRVAGGNSAMPGEVRWQLQIRHKGRLTCGATLVRNKFSEQIVLTAGQCITDRATGAFLKMSDLEIIAGRVTLDKTHDVEQTRKVVKIFRHPKFLQTYSYCLNDVAVLHLDQNFDLNRLISPVDLTIYEDYKGEDDVVISGWGHTDLNENHYWPQLQEASVQRFSNPECAALYKNKISEAIFNTVFCAGLKEWESEEQPGHGPCDGDIGGPAVSVIGRHLYIVGIYNWRQPKCENRKLPSIFTDLSYFIKWINNLETPESAHWISSRVGSKRAMKLKKLGTRLANPTVIQETHNVSTFTV